MSERKLYIPSLIGFFFAILISQNVSFSQSKKKQIEALNFKIDSVNQVISKERNTQKTSIGSFEIQEFKSKQKVDSLTKEINSVENQISSQQNNKQIIESEMSRLKKEIEKQRDSLKQLLSNEEERLQISSDDSYFIFFKDDYDFNIEEPVFNPDNGYSDQIVEKEKNRISSSKHATRKVDLKINLLNGSVAIYKSSFKDYTFHTYYSYLFEDLKTSKIFFVQIDYIDAGGGSKNISLLELNLKDGKVRKIIEDAGGDFFFNSNNTFVISSGWVQSDEEEYAQDCKLELISIDNLKKELVFNGIEPVEIKWNSRNEFQCMLLKYGKEIEWPFTRIPSDIRTSELFNFKLEDSIWQGYSTVNFDKKKYKIAVIGSNIWMAENLNVSNFRNGDPIPEAKTEDEWKKAGENKQPAWCYYNYDSKNETKYGKLYNGYAVNDLRQIAPEGWHVSNEVEWISLEKKYSSIELKSEKDWKMVDVFIDCKNCLNWKDRHNQKNICSVCKGTTKTKQTISGNGNNSSGFSGLPGAYCDKNGKFNDDFGYFGCWWWSEYDTDPYDLPYTMISVDGRYLDGTYGGYLQSSFSSKEKGFSVRCVKD